MARSFTASSTQYLTNTSFAAPARPFTMAFWFYPTSATVGETQMVFANTGNNIPLFGTRINITANKFGVIQRDDNVDLGESITTASYTASGWNHGAGVFLSDSSRTAWLNGVAATTDTTVTAGGTTTNNLAIGAWNRTTAVNLFDGRIADAAVWSVALTAPEIVALAGGARPSRIRPLSLIGYWPLDGIESPEPDFAQARAAIHNMTLTNTPPFLKLLKDSPPGIG